MTTIEQIQNAIKLAKEMFNLDQIWVSADHARFLGIAAGFHPIDYLEHLIGEDDGDRGSSSPDQ